MTYSYTFEQLGWSALEIPSDMVEEVINFLRSGDDIAPGGSSFAWTSERGNKATHQTMYLSQASMDRLERKYKEHFTDLPKGSPEP